MPVTHWSGPLLGQHLRSHGWDISNSSVQRILKSARLQPHRQRVWITSQDEEFRSKRDNLLRIYYDTPADEHIVCVDEMTSIQVLERRLPDAPMQPRQPARRQFEYIRHGVVDLMGALDVRLGRVFGFLSDRHNAQAFVALLDVIDTCYPSGRGHVVCDNQSAHDAEDVLDWLEDHPRWTLHFTPKHASWLNQIELMFGILRRRVTARGSFASPEELQHKLYAYMLWHNRTAQPFEWSYRPRSWTSKQAQTSDEGY